MKNRVILFFTFEVRFKYRNLGGFDNLQVNGDSLHIKPLFELPAVVAQDVQAFHTTGPDFNTLSLVGPITTVLIGGQELLLDNVCAGEAWPWDQWCINFDALPPATQYGAPAGHIPGQEIYFEPFMGGALSMQVDSFFWTNTTGTFNFCTVRLFLEFYDRWAGIAYG